MRRDDMRAHLLVSAVRVLETEGASGFSVRAVTAAAGVNVASVTTAFGGRGPLVDALFVRLMTPINAERHRRYRDLGDRPAVAAITRAFLEPLLAVDRADGSAVSALLQLLMTDPDLETMPVDRVLRDPGVATFDRLLAEALGDVADEERTTRVRLGVGTVVAAAALGEAPLTEVHLDRLVAFVAAGLAGEA